MATTDFVFNIARGCTKFYYFAVENSTVLAASGQFTAAADSALIVVAINDGAVSDDAMKDFDDLAALLASAANEATNSGYARKVLTETELAAVPVPDDTNNRYELVIPDQVWTAVQTAGGAWTGLVVCFRPNAAAADSAIIPITHHAFAVTPDGSDITADVPTLGFYRSA